MTVKPSAAAFGSWLGLKRSSCLRFQGVEGISGVAFAFLYATAMVFTITGFANQCGCSIRHAVCLLTLLYAKKVSIV